MNEIIGILDQLRELLSRYGHDERASFIDRLTRQGEPGHFWQTVSGIEFWGGSGAVWEIEPFQFSHPSEPASFDDYRRFQRLMIDLGALLEARRMSSLSSPTVSLFRRQLGEGASG